MAVKVGFGAARHGGRGAVRFGPAGRGGARRSGCGSAR